jgi:hypothetical protein
MDDRGLDARDPQVWRRHMHLKMKDRVVDEQSKGIIREFMDKMVAEGRAEYDDNTDRYRMTGEDFPPPDMQGFLEEWARRDS